MCNCQTGTFKLEMNYLPLLRLFDDKLNWARLMARSKDVHFSVEDDTDSTETGFQATMDRNRPTDDSRLESAEGTSYMTILIDSEYWTPSTLISTAGESVSVSECLESVCLAGTFARIDAGKIDQVLRNLLTNAVHFYCSSCTS